MNFNTPHLWILLVFIGLSFLQWLIRRLQEQSAVNRQKQQAARRRDEILRTGREPDAPAQPAPSSPDAAARQARLRELRQKQLEEMRRKNSRQSPTTTVEARVPPRPSTTPARPTPTLGAPTGARQGARPGAGPG
ncbi:MAG: hypothetical protein IBJ10_11895, partial [Phycisphaerales bacterium]|nr:hypothetical protein [Phycisphaerales bacterium]